MSGRASGFDWKLAMHKGGVFRISDGVFGSYDYENHGWL